MKISSVFFTVILMTQGAFAELSVNEAHVFQLNDVDVESCAKDFNKYPKSNPSYYGCERTRKVLYSAAADLTKVESGDPKKPVANVLGSKPVPQGVNVLRSYVVEPPLQNKSARPDHQKPGLGMGGIDWSRADNLVRSAARNLIQPVIDEKGNELTMTFDESGRAIVNDRGEGVSIPNHGISHAFMELKCEGLRPILTGMSTGKDIESPVNFFIHNLGLGILFRTQVGRMNTYKELRDEINVRQQRAGDITFVDYKLNKENCRYVYYSVMEMVAEGIQKRYGSLTDRMMNGTGMGCAMFDVGVKQMAGVIPVREEILSPQKKQQALAENPCEFSHHWNRTIYVPRDYLPQPVEGEESLKPAEVGILSLLLSGDDAESFVYWAQYLVGTLLDTAIEKIEGFENFRENIVVKVLKGGLEKLAGLLEKDANSFMANFILAGVQTGLNNKVFINETLKPQNSGYSFSEGASPANETLSFWDPQLYATWTRNVHKELNDLKNGVISEEQVACVDWKKDAFKPKKDGYMVGLEIDWTQRQAPEESIFKRFDYLRAFSQEEVDPFKEYDGNPETLQAIFEKNFLDD